MQTDDTSRFYVDGKYMCGFFIPAGIEIPKSLNEREYSGLAIPKVLHKRDTLLNFIGAEPLARDASDTELQLSCLFGRLYPLKYALDLLEFKDLQVIVDMYCGGEDSVMSFSLPNGIRILVCSAEQS
jgi:hypothetical protein